MRLRFLEVQLLHEALIGEGIDKTFERWPTPCVIQWIPTCYIEKALKWFIGVDRF